MLEDREYMRQPGFEPRISCTVALLIVNAIVFVAQHISAANGGQNFQDTYCALSLAGLKSGYVWELLTFQFMHLGLMHILFNSLAIFFFGRMVESALGGIKLLTIYFSAGVIGGLVQMLYALVFHAGDSVVGASAGAAGLVGAFAILAWDEQFTLFLYFIPVNMRGKTLLWVSIAGCLVMTALGDKGIANAAHLGGILTGALFVRQIVQGRWHLPQWRLASRRYAPRELAAKRATKKSFWNATSIPPAEDLTPDEFLQKEVDPILDKISELGIQSLTARERDILEKARSRMNRR
ncbi:MAG TPA: rhomboid family intramembrane serine protease [Verrucomicrobiae bacterium]